MKITKGISLRKDPVELLKTQDAKIHKASKMYEKQFLAQMLKAMRSTVSHSKLTEPNFAQKIYQGQMDQQYIESWSQRGGVGFSKIIYDQIKGMLSHAGRGPVPPPSGPLPVNKPKGVLPVDKAPVEVPRFKIIHPKPQELGSRKTESSFYFEKDPSREVGAVELSSPWGGVVESSFVTELGHKVLKIKHDFGLQSVLSFKGELAQLKPGQKLAAGQKLGAMGAEAIGLSWKLGLGIGLKA